MEKNRIGVDLGATKIVVVRMTEKGLIEEEKRLSTPAKKGMEIVLGEIIEIAKGLQNDQTQSLGIGIPGLIMQPEGLLLEAPNIAESKNFPVREFLQKRMDLPVTVENDANCFALAEATLGSAKDKRLVVGITFGTGVGGGIVRNGVIEHGAHGHAGEIGHMLLLPGQPPYTTKDLRGEVEQFLSGTAMGKRCEEAKSPEEYLEGEVCSFMQPDIEREVAWLCTNLTYLLDPEIIVFGGSAGIALSKRIDAITEEAKKWMLPTSPLPEIVGASLKDAGAIGAALASK